LTCWVGKEGTAIASVRNETKLNESTRVVVWRSGGFCAVVGEWSVKLQSRSLCPGDGNLLGGLSIPDFERWMKGGSRKGVPLSEEAQCGGPLDRAPLLGTLQDMLRKAPDTGLSLRRGPYTSEGNLESGGVALYQRS
jgi:hypothetical protein